MAVNCEFVRIEVPPYFQSPCTSMLLVAPRRCALGLTFLHVVRTRLYTEKSLHSRFVSAHPRMSIYLKVSDKGKVQNRCRLSSTGFPVCSGCRLSPFCVVVPLFPFFSYVFLLFVNADVSVVGFVQPLARVIVESRIFGLLLVVFWSSQLESS